VCVCVCVCGVVSVCVCVCVCVCARVRTMNSSKQLQDIVCFQMLIIMSYPLLPCLVRANPGGIARLNCPIPSPSHWWNSSLRDGGRSLTRADQNRVIQDPPFNYSVLIRGSSITSSAVLPVSAELNGTIVSCRDAFGVVPDVRSWLVLVTGEENKNRNGSHLTVILFLSMSTLDILQSYERLLCMQSIVRLKSKVRICGEVPNNFVAIAICIVFRPQGVAHSQLMGTGRDESNYM